MPLMCKCCAHFRIPRQDTTLSSFALAGWQHTTPLSNDLLFYSHLKATIIWACVLQQCTVHTLMRLVLNWLGGEVNVSLLHSQRHDICCKKKSQLTAFLRLIMLE